MSKSDEYREMQISSGQLAAVILALLALCVFVFYLGTRVGMKKAAASNPAAESVSLPKANPPVTATEDAARKPAETKAAPEKVESGKALADPAGNKPQPKTEAKPAATGTKTAGTETKPPAAEPKPKAAEGTKTASAAGTYYIQAGALDTRPKAEDVAQKIEGLGFRAIVLNPFAGDKKAVYRVRVGPYDAKEAAQAALGKLAEALKRKASDFFVVKG